MNVTDPQIDLHMFFAYLFPVLYDYCGHFFALSIAVLAIWASLRKVRKLGRHGIS